MGARRMTAPADPPGPGRSRETVRMFLKHLRTLALVLAASLAFPATAQDFSPDEEARIKALALEAILERPEILKEAIAILQQRDQQAKAASVAQVLEARREALERDANAPVIGAPDGDVTVVEFFDYNCPYCKKAADELKPVLAADDGVRVVMREWPILGEGSVFAARAALAAREQGKYEEMHWALMNLRRADERSTLQAAEEIGLDVERLRRDMEAPEVESHIAVSMALARDLGFTGTPSFVIGDALAPGMISRDALEKMIEDARGR